MGQPGELDLTLRVKIEFNRRIFLPNCGPAAHQHPVHTTGLQTLLQAPGTPTRNSSRPGVEWQNPRGSRDCSVRGS